MKEFGNESYVSNCRLFNCTFGQVYNAIKKNSYSNRF